MSRKFILALLAILVLATVQSATAQQPKKTPTIGILTLASDDPLARVLREGLRELGYVEGKTIIIERRYAEGKEDRLPDLAVDLIRLKVDVIVAGGGNAVRAAKNATKTIPIVMAGASDAVGTGLVTSLARPGGNVTGSTAVHTDLSGKRLELLKEAIPGITRVAALIYRGNPAYALLLKETQTAAKSVGIQLQILDVRDAKELQKTFDAAKKGGSQAINIISSAFFITERTTLVELAAKAGLPAIYIDRSFVEAGGLMSYGANISDGWFRAATYVDKILKGAKPADLPVEQPTKFELVINLKTAKQIGLTIPPNVLARADKVIK
jgi:putative ABC transport system substrate-binding protein